MIWLVLSIAAWGLVHSWLASLPVKTAIGRAFGEPGARAYRLAYNAFSVLSFAPLLLLMRVPPDQPVYSVPAPWLYLMLSGQALSAVGVIVGVVQTDALHFIGLRQLMQPDKSAKFITGGLYRWMRHPLYFFGLLFMWLTPVMTRNMLVAYLALTLYLFVGALFEESKLLREHGEAYRQYRSRTPMIIPLGPPRGQQAHAPIDRR